MRKIIAGVDGSDPSIEALEWAVRFALDVGGHVLAVHAFTPIQSEKRPGLMERLLAEQHDRLATWCTGVLEPVDHDLEVIEGDARDKLLEVAEREHADLLVVSTVGASGARPGPLSFGSVVEHLARTSKVAVAVIPPDPDTSNGPPPPIDRMVVAVDGSEHSKAAVRWLAGIERVREGTTAVTAVTVESPGLLRAGTEQMWIDAGHRSVDPDWLRPLEEQGIGYEPRTVDGMSPDDGIFFAAHHAGASAIVMGMRGAGGFAGLTLGGTAVKVIRRTTLPVILVPPGAVADAT